MRNELDNGRFIPADLNFVSKNTIIKSAVDDCGLIFGGDIVVEL